MILKTKSTETRENITTGIHHVEIQIGETKYLLSENVDSKLIITKSDGDNITVRPHFANVVELS